MFLGLHVSLFLLLWPSLLVVWQMTQMSASVVKLAEKEQAVLAQVDRAKEATRARDGEIVVLKERVAQLADDGPFPGGGGAGVHAALSLSLSLTHTHTAVRSLQRTREVLFFISFFRPLEVFTWVLCVYACGCQPCGRRGIGMMQCSACGLQPTP